MSGGPVISAQGVDRAYSNRGGLGRRKGNTGGLAVRDVSLALDAGESLAIVGESGCGKSTMARILALWDEPTAGTVLIDGVDPRGLSTRERRRLHRDVQLIPQDPYDALDPRWTISRIVAEPLVLQGLVTSREHQRQRVIETLRRVGLNDARGILSATPRDLSGGERQRIAIARAIILRPKVIIADEPLSMVDVSARAGILNLLNGIIAESTALIYISHDLEAARVLCDRTAVMYGGRIVETGPSDPVFFDPAHPYTALLRSATPRIENPDRPRVIDTGEAPGLNPQGDGCGYAPRCPLATEICTTTRPGLRTEGREKSAACWHRLDEPAGAHPAVESKRRTP
jgi:oligopeptide/dipeptide ABC transporter ATP-binding protein